MPAVEAYSLGVPVEHGYITFSMGDPVRALYHDTSGDDLGWSFGYWFPSRCVGATPATATLPQAPTPVPTPAPTAGDKLCLGGVRQVASWASLVVTHGEGVVWRLVARRTTGGLSPFVQHLHECTAM